MALVVIGPSSVGKSTLLQTRPHHIAIDSKYTSVSYGYELKRKPMTANTVIHYNMLKLGRGRYWRLFPRTAAQRWRIINQDWDFDAEPTFARIFNSGMVEHCIVLVTPVQELVERIETRTVSELDKPSPYPRRFWHQATTQLHLNRIYEQLFEKLEQRAVPYAVYYSSKAVNGFARTERVAIDRNLAGHFCPTT